MSERSYGPYRDVGHRIADLRAAFARAEGRRVTQAELAGRVGVHVGTWTAWEGGHQRPEGENLDRLCELFGTSRSWILDGEGADLLVVSEGRVARYPAAEDDPEADSATAVSQAREDIRTIRRRIDSIEDDIATAKAAAERVQRLIDEALAAYTVRRLVRPAIDSAALARDDRDAQRSGSRRTVPDTPDTE